MFVLKLKKQVSLTRPESEIARQMAERGYIYGMVPMSVGAAPLYCKSLAMVCEVFRMYPATRFHTYTIDNLIGG